jgi:hypothetical protein
MLGGIMTSAIVPFIERFLADHEAVSANNVWPVSEFGRGAGRIAGWFDMVETYGSEVYIGGLEMYGRDSSRARLEAQREFFGPAPAGTQWLGRWCIPLGLDLAVLVPPCGQGTDSSVVSVQLDGSPEYTLGRDLDEFLGWTTKLLIGKSECPREGYQVGGQQVQSRRDDVCALVTGRSGGDRSRDRERRDWPAGRGTVSALGQLTTAFGPGRKKSFPVEEMGPYQGYYCEEALQLFEWQDRTQCGLVYDLNTAHSARQEALSRNSAIWAGLLPIMPGAAVLLPPFPARSAAVILHDDFSPICVISHVLSHVFGSLSSSIQEGMRTLNSSSYFVPALDWIRHTSKDFDP